jgi:glycosyltransferase involved in cell wall biosynthesis
MKLLVVTHNYPRFVGDPAGAFVARLAREAAAAGHAVRVIAPHAPGLARAERRDGVDLRRFRYAPERWERIGYTGDLHRRSALSPIMTLGVPAFLSCFAAAIARSLREFRPEVVHAHWWFPGGTLAAAVPLPLVVTCHGSDVRLLDRIPPARPLARWVFDRAAVVTTVSRFLAEDVRRVAPKVASRLRVAPMPLDVQLFAQGLSVAKSQPPRILYAGNLIPSKGVSDLVRAIGILNRRGVKCVLRILGEGPELEGLRKLVAMEGLTGLVEVSPFVPQAAMPAEYGAATVTVLPTRGREEGLGLTLVEALLAGSAVVGTDAGGIPEVAVHGETGLIARGDDPEDLAQKVGTLLTDSELRRRLSDEGRRRVATTFDSRTASRIFLEIYDDVLRSDRPA